MTPLGHIDRDIPPLKGGDIHFIVYCLILFLGSSSADLGFFNKRFHCVISAKKAYFRLLSISCVVTIIMSRGDNLHMSGHMHALHVVRAVLGFYKAFF